MNSIGGIFLRIFIFLLVLAAGTFILLFLLEIIAIPIPPVQSYLSCPPGSNIDYAMKKQPYDRPGQTSMVRACLDANGKNTEAFSNEIYNQRQFNLFLPIGFGLTLLGEFIWMEVRFLKRLNGRQ